MHRVTLAQRAFELARDGSCHSTDDIRRKLIAERYSAVSLHLSSRTLIKQLRTLMTAAAKTAER